jgi:hypothetical protein
MCAAGSTTTAFSGAGNICADPQLAAPDSGDVHESASSPTIDAGSNALVPAGLASDFYGRNRIVGTKQVAGRVDIGAAEDQTAFNPVGTATASGEKPTKSGVKLTITCSGASGQTCSGGITVTTTETLRGAKIVGVTARAKHHKPRKHRRKVTVGRGSYTLSAGEKRTLTIRLNRTGAKLLKRFGKLPVTVTVTEIDASGHTVNVSARKLTIRRPHHKRRRH